ncbi:MAG: SET domain-containing protein [Candidatus Micrarchaeota archaeon]|nr:SET domain-containing protein [Candidatus Micrarchaeota archaeon]
MGKIVKIGKSKISGKGIFATKDIRKGQLIFVMKGERITFKQMVKRVNQGAERGSDPLQIGAKTYLDLDEFSRVFNHSCNPNSFIRGKDELVSIRNIKSGEEITFDYSSTMDDNYQNASRGIWTNRCRCGATNCRGSVDQFRFLPKRRREFYLKNKYAPDFILKKF